MRSDDDRLTLPHGPGGPSVSLINRTARPTLRLMVDDLARSVIHRTRNLARMERRRLAGIVREFDIPADLRSNERYLARERRDQFGRARLAAAVMAGYALGAVPVLILTSQQRQRLDVAGASLLWAVTALVLWRVIAPRMRHHPTVIAILVCAAGTGLAMTFELLEPGLSILTIGSLTIIPLASTILLFWRPRTHLVVLALFYATTIVYATVLSPAIEPNARWGAVVVTGVACLLSAFGNYEGTLRRNTRARQARRLQQQRSELRRIATERAQEARTDVLTGLGSRRAMNEDLARLGERLVHSGGRAALALLDLDRFKLYNDRLGHAAGDELLRQFGRLLREGMRLGDFAYRYGGEEFLLALEDASPAEAGAVIERIRHSMATVSWGDTEHDTRPPVTFSAGVAEIDLTRGATIEAALRLADRGLYIAKAQGRNRTVGDQDFDGSSGPTGAFDHDGRGQRTA